MKTAFLLLTLFLFNPHSNVPELSKQEAKAAFLLLNQIRSNPKRFSTKLNVSLDDVKPMPHLKWNDTLAKVAEAKALDMANRDYFAHVNPDGYGINYFINAAGYKLDPSWLKDIKYNYFESCNAGGLSGEEAIGMLIIDEGVPSLGHRKHLLGIDEWSATLYDIGIGYVRTNGKGMFKSYTCVIIAKHK